MKNTIKFYLLITALMLFVCGCAEDTTKHDKVLRAATSTDCTKVTDKLISFVENCIKNANPKSDEEPEDWIKECKVTGKDILCSAVTGFRYRFDNGSVFNYSAFIACKKATTTKEKELCGDIVRDLK